MPELQSQKRARSKAVGSQRRAEVSLIGARRLDTKTRTKTRLKATEVVRNGRMASLEKAAQRLKSARAPQKVLQVPQKDMPKAAQAMRKVRVGGTVKNMTGTKRQSVSKPSPKR